jgi:hypothetical protein
MSRRPERFVLPPKNLVTGAPKARIVKLSDPSGGSDPSGSDYYLKPRLCRGFFMSAIHPFRKHIVRVVLKTQDHQQARPAARTRWAWGRPTFTVGPPTNAPGLAMMPRRAVMTRALTAGPHRRAKESPGLAEAFQKARVRSRNGLA